MTLHTIGLHLQQTILNETGHGGSQTRKRDCMGTALTTVFVNELGPVIENEVALSFFVCAYSNLAFDQMTQFSKNDPGQQYVESRFGLNLHHSHNLRKQVQET